MGRTPRGVGLVQRATQSNVKPLRRSNKLGQTADMSKLQLLSLCLPSPNEVVCVQISFAVSDEGDRNQKTKSVSTSQFRKTHSLAPVMKGCGDRLTCPPPRVTGSICRSYNVKNNNISFPPNLVYFL